MGAGGRGEMLSREDIYDKKTDARGVPQRRINCSSTKNENKIREVMATELINMPGAAGCEEVRPCVNEDTVKETKRDDL